MRIMGIQQKIACLFVERSRTLYEMGSWSDSLRMSGFGKQISKDANYCKEIEKVSDMQNRDAKTRLRERVGMIEKRSRGTLERCRGLFRIKKRSKRSTPSPVELPVVGSLTRPGKRT
jgi:hypothetical protein